MAERDLTLRETWEIALAMAEAGQAVLDRDHPREPTDWETWEREHGRIGQKGTR